MSIKKILYIILFFIIFSFANAEENLKSVGKFKDWESFVLLQDGNKTCFAQSAPVVRAPRKLKITKNKIVYKIFFMDMDLDIFFEFHLFFQLILYLN